ncbi:MAG: disulfide oxidoreductase, partial [Alphaproteobacteria bacterium]
EVAQIAGRAGRHMNDGTFGTAADVGPLDADIVDAVENHRFRALKAINWRNTVLSFTSLKALLGSLEAAPPAPGLARAPDADDYLALAALARDDEIAALATTPAAVGRLWEVCRIPDYRKLMADAHVRLLDRIYRHLMQGDGHLPDDWVARLVARHDRSDGDIDTLAARIAHIRTWTYVSHRTGWLADAAHWQERTRAIEDRLSDALHERLTEQFIDRRTAVLVRRMKDDGDIAASVADDGAVEVEGHFIGRLEGFRFIADAASAPHESKALRRAAKRGLKGEIAKSVAALVADADAAFGVDERAQVLWRGRPVARLVAGTAALAPRLEPAASELLDGPASDKVRRRLDAWLAGYLRATVGPLLGADAGALSGPVRGLLFQLGEELGAVPRRAVARQLQALKPEDRKALAARDVRLGREAVFVRGLLKPRALGARALLWAVHAKQPRVPPAPDGGRVSVVVDEALPVGFYAAIGYRVFGRRALRLDIVERVAAAARRLAREGPFEPAAELAALAGCTAEELDEVLAGLGYRRQEADDDSAPRYAAPGRTRGGKPRRAPRRPRKADPASPFAKLAGLRSGT